MSALLDADSKFEVVYSLFEHEKLGQLIGAYVVQATDVPGVFGMKYNRLLPENVERFAHNLDDTDCALVSLLHELTLQNLYKKFKKKEPSLQHFISQFNENPLRKYVLEYIERRVGQALPKMAGRNFYLMSKDGYPAYRRLLPQSEPASVSYCIRRGETGLRYEARLEFQGRRLALHTRPGGVVGVKPAWIWTDDKLLAVPDTPDGRRLKPFFSRPEVAVPKTSEAEYFRKFITRLLADHEIEAEGFEVATVEAEPGFSLEIHSDNTGIVALRPRVHYAGHSLPVDAREKFQVQVETPDSGAFAIRRIRRSREREGWFIQFFEALRTDGASLIDFSLPEAKAYEWIAQHLPGLMAAGIEVRQQLGAEEFSFALPTLEWDAQPLDAHNPRGPLRLLGAVWVDGQQLPLHALRPNILRGDGKARLPDGRFVYLPLKWLESLRHLMEVARPMGDGLRIEPYHLGILNAAFRDKGSRRAGVFHDFEQIVTQPLPEGLHATLRDYQKAGFDWLCFLREYRMGGILADEMGLGKTLQTLTLLLAEKNAGAQGPALVVVPNSLVYNWVAEAERFTPKLRVLVYRGQRRTDLVSAFFNHDIIIATYGTIRNDVDQLKLVPFRYLVLDESHRIKNREAKISRAVMELQGQFRLSLTGTPVENSTMDLWTQMEFLNPGLLGAATFFERHYADPIEKDRNDERATELHDLVRPFILRRTKEMVAQDLPERIEQVQHCEMTPAQERLYTRTSSLYRRTLFADKGEASLARNRIQVLSSIQRLRQIAIHPALVDPTVQNSGKYDLALELLADVVAAGHKVLIFSQFVKLLRIFQTDLNRKGCAYGFLDGSMRPEDRAREVDRFQTEPQVPVFLISLSAGGVGLNLTAAQYVFLLDPWWNPAVEQQAISRAHRIGQVQSVVVYRFITKDTIEEKILKLQARKLQIAKDVVGSDKQFFKTLSKEDLEGLFG